MRLPTFIQNYHIVLEASVVCNWKTVFISLFVLSNTAIANESGSAGTSI